MTIEGSPPAGTARAGFAQADAVAQERILLTEVWERLATGSARVVEHFYSSERSYLVLEPASRPLKSASKRNLALLEQAMLGKQLKVLAADENVAQSTVSTAVAEALRAMGLNGNLAAAPMICVMALHAQRRLVPLTVARSVQLGGQLVVSVERPDGWLRARLAPMEWEVARLRLEGASYAAIAAKRKTSMRTIANQLASIFRKLGVSGRSELLGFAIRGSTEDDERSGVRDASELPPSSGVEPARGGRP